MTNEIPKQNWNMFFNDLTKRRFDWQTKIEVFNEDIGNQILDEGLSFSGITCEQDGDDTIVEIFVGNIDNQHQTHNIKNPTKVAYLGEDDKPGGVVEFEETDGTKTLLHIIQPMPIKIKYFENQESKTA